VPRRLEQRECQGTAQLQDRRGVTPTVVGDLEQRATAAAVRRVEAGSDGAVLKLAQTTASGVEEDGDFHAVGRPQRGRPGDDQPRYDVDKLVHPWHRKLTETLRPGAEFDGTSHGLA
jgi:hypothetical protein